MWQKERLLNLLIEQVPEEFDQIAWIDADVIFKNTDWHNETKELLQKYPVVQLFERVFELDATGASEPPKESHAYAKFLVEKTKWRKPGGAWAADRKALRQMRGLQDTHILGGGDTLMLNAWEGMKNTYLQKHMNPEWLRHYLVDSIRYYQIVRDRFAVVSGDITHLYHGTRENRQYVKRNAILVDNGFDPKTDIALDHNGLWKWNSDKPDLHKRVKEYFVNRKEDD